jgi:ATP-dependent DNA helicase RecG
MADLRAEKAVSRCYRNRRIRDFLKELDLTEGRFWMKKVLSQK